MSPAIQKQLPAIRRLLAHYAVEHASLFGSYAKDTATAESDVDMLVQFRSDLDYVSYADNYFGLLQALRELLQKDVDLIAEETVQNPYFRQSIEAHKIPIL